MRTKGKGMGREWVSFWITLLSACLFITSFAIACLADSEMETITSEAMPWFLSAGEAARIAMKQEKESFGEEKTAAWVRINWEDKEYPAKRPESILCRLYRNGIATAHTVTLRPGNGWQMMIGGLDRSDSSGAEIKWTWKEITPLDSGYYVQGDSRMEPHTETIDDKIYAGFLTILMNRLTVTELTIEKIWLNDQGVDRPKELAVKLNRQNAVGEAYEGEEGTRNVTLTAADQDTADTSRWRKTIRNLPVIEGDVWHISEAVPKGYSAEGKPVSAKTVSGTIAPGVLTLRNRKVEKDKPAKRPEAGGGNSGSRSARSVNPEDNPAQEELLPIKIPDVGAPKRTMVILVISGIALAVAGIVMARAGQKTGTKRIGYGVTAIGVMLATLVIPLAVRYLEESNGAKSAQESARAALSETLLRSFETPVNDAMPDGENGTSTESPKGAVAETEEESKEGKLQIAESADTAETEAIREAESKVEELQAAESSDTKEAVSIRDADSGVKELQTAESADTAEEVKSRDKKNREEELQSANSADTVDSMITGDGKVETEEQQTAITKDTGKAPADKNDETRVETQRQGLNYEDPANPKTDASDIETVDAKTVTDVRPDSDDKSEQQAEPVDREEERLQVLAGRISEAVLRGMLWRVEPDSAGGTQIPEETSASEEDPGTGTPDAVYDPHTDYDSGTEMRNETEGEKLTNIAEEPQDEKRTEKQLLWTPEMELRILWANGKRYAGLASAPSLALAWPIQADWKEDSLSVSPGVFFGKPYGDRFILIGHNYPTHFGTIEDLKPGDEVYFQDFSGNRFTYEVIRTDYLNPQDMDLLLNDQAAFTLVTCARDGNRRAAVRCKRKE